MFGSKNTYINDRLFSANPMGFTHLGHSEPSNKPYDKKDPNENKQLIGDDLGREDYFAI